MSLRQITLDELNRPVLTKEQEREQEWLEANANMPATTECRNCGAFVSDRFVRVLGTNGRINGCANCCTFRELFDGAGGERR
jgi:hypothetical protein